MPLYGAAQAGSVLTAVYPSEKFTLFDGTETPSAGLKSVAFNRAPGNGQSGNGMVFSVTFPSAPTATVYIQGSNDDVDAHYQTLNGSGITSQTGWYDDAGEFRFYRAVLNSYSAGSMPTVIVQR